MPWHKVHEHSECPISKPWAVVKDGGGPVVGCHATETAANKQLAALYASEEDKPMSGMKTRTRVAGPMAVEGDHSGDGRMIEHGAVTWDGVLPAPIVFDILEGDHSGPTIGAVEEVFRRPDGVLWGEGYVEDSDVPQVQEWVTRARELLDQGAVGVSVGMDSEVVELRVKRDVMSELETEPIPDASGERLVVATFARDDALEVITSARFRHLAIVDTAAIVTPAGERFSVVPTGAVAAAGMVAEWLGHEHFFDDPKFGDPSSDPRLRYDPERDLWSCPNTVNLETGQVFGHITPMGICLRGRPDRCVNPPDGDLEGFMRGRAPAAGGRRTGVISCGGGSSHCDIGIGIIEATQFYDKVGHGTADVRVGRDRYGIWYAGMIRPGTSSDDIYRFAASDVSGHWEYPLHGVRNRATLVGLPSVSVGGFPKGYLTYDEFRSGLAAAGGITVEDGCGSLYGELEETSDIDARLARIEMALGEMYAAHLLARDR